MYFDTPCRHSNNKGIIGLNVITTSANNSGPCYSAEDPRRRRDEQLPRVTMFAFNLSRVLTLNPFTSETRLHTSRWIIRSSSFIPSARHAWPQINCISSLFTISLSVIHSPQPPCNDDTFSLPNPLRAFLFLSNTSLSAAAFFRQPPHILTYNTSQLGLPTKLYNTRSSYISRKQIYIPY